ncbi:unnamed protein product [Mytilus edulis]|uniref:Uncharacterized protein n=1 Tax=Mytilus edulis TaxID=6550 RepID=A0A8S3RST2_MYTED|nr:unnamed protein product [Mytilus edulis]
MPEHSFNNVAFQQQQIAAMTGLQLRMEKLESTTATIDKKTNSTVDIFEKYLNLEKKYEVVLRKQVQLQDDLNISRNRTTELEKEIESLKHIQTINQLQTLSSLQQEIQTLQQDVNSLTTTSQARGQDLTAIYSDVVQNKHKLITLVNETTTINHKLANSDNNHMSLMRDFSIFRKTQNNTTNNLISKQQ